MSRPCVHTAGQLHIVLVKVCVQCAMLSSSLEKETPSGSARKQTRFVSSRWHETSIPYTARVHICMLIQLLGLFNGNFEGYSVVSLVKTSVTIKKKKN